MGPIRQLCNGHFIVAVFLFGVHARGWHIGRRYAKHAGMRRHGG